MTDTEARVEEVRKEHGPTPGDDHCACDVRYGAGCWVGVLLDAYTKMRAQRDAEKERAEKMQDKLRAIRAAWCHSCGSVVSLEGASHE